MSQRRCHGYRKPPNLGQNFTCSVVLNPFDQEISRGAATKGFFIFGQGIGSLVTLKTQEIDKVNNLCKNQATA